jgi:tRNA threonylcarbamoyladenosine biosynthesis protein TsaB
LIGGVAFLHSTIANSYLQSMLHLAIDTSTRATGLALAEDDLLESRRFGGGLNAGEHLVPAIDRLFADHGRSKHELKRITIAIGPGSFTGLRIGLATAKGLALALELPIVPVSTLEVLAMQAPVREGLVVPVIQARKGEVYHGAWRRHGGNLERAGDPARSETAELLEKLPVDAFLIGPALSGMQEQITALDREVAIAGPEDRELNLSWLLSLGNEKARRESAVDVATLEPEYMQAFRPTKGRSRL